jgi:CCDC81-like prokaryotic HU domain 1
LEALGLVSDTQITSLLPDMGMDLSNYVSKLLQQHGHLYVPGLGYFVHLRKSSYYDNATETLYPPYYETIFDADHIESDDHNLLNFISSERNISTASAQYFLEKFPAMIKSKAEAGEFDFEGLGIFSIDEQSKLVFKPNQSGTNFNSPLYGLPPVKIKKLEGADEPIQTIEETPVAVVPDFVPEPAVPVIPTPVQETYVPPVPVYNTPPPVVEAEPELEVEVEEEQPKSKTIYWVILIVIVIAAIAGFLAYQYKLINFGTAPVAVKAKPVAQPKADSDTTKKDTSTTATVKADSTVKTVQPVVSTTPILGEIPKNTWLILGGSFNNYANATRALTNYRALGHPEARMLDSVQHKEFFVYKIVFGYQPTKKQADSVKLAILRPRTIKAKFIFVEPYK